MFRRRTTAEQTVSDPQPAEAGPPGTAPPKPKPGGKGRPTPKRKEAQTKRRLLGAPPKNRKEWVRRQRAQARDERAKAREAMARGEAVLPRDRGPVRKFARDYVDARRSFAEYVLPTMFVILMLSFWPNPAVQLYAFLALYGYLLLVIIDSVILNRGLKRELRRRHPDENMRGVTSYAVMRSMQIRGLRMPKPQARRGARL